MKKGFLAIGKASFYFAVYFFVQIIVSVGFTVGLSAKMIMEATALGKEIDTGIMLERLEIEIMEQAMLMTLVAGVLTLFVYWLLFFIRKKRFGEEVCLYPLSLEGVLPITIMAACFNVVTTVVISFIPWPESWMESYAISSSAIDNSLLAWITAVFMAPILEEVVFRGLIYTRLKKGLPLIVAAILTSLVFGIMHGTIIWFFYTFVVSMVLIWIFEKFHSLTACILFHLLYNFSGMILSIVAELMAVLILPLFVGSLFGIYFGYRKVLELV